MEEIIQTTISTTINEVIEHSNLLGFDWATLVLSVIALMVSIWSVVWTVRKNNESSYKNNLYQDILKKPLHEELPSCIQKSIDLNNKSIDDLEIDKFQDFLMDLRIKILVFKYTDNEFYEEMENNIVKIDEYIVLISNRKENFEKRYEELILVVKNLYKCVEQHFYK